MDFVIQKATELGVKEIHPLVTTRSIVQETRRLMRWQRIAEAAVEQCGRTVVPIILEPVKFNSFFERFKAGAKPIGIIFWEEGGMSLKEAIQKITSRNLSARRESGAEKGFSEPGIQDNIYVFIGPEGGLTAQEVDTASQRGMIVTTLGPRILRVETAAIAAVSLMQFLLGDMG
jgi:16S rRNA (uracil1498-N3)-methyltransferase